MNTAEGCKSVSAIEHKETSVTVADLDSVNQQRIKLLHNAIYLRGVHTVLVAGVSLSSLCKDGEKEINAAAKAAAEVASTTIAKV